MTKTSSAPQPQCKSHVQAERLAKSGMTEEAVALLMSMIEKDPENADALWTLGNVHFDNGDYHLAYPAYKHFVRLRENEPGGWSNFARCLYHLGHFEAAVIAGERAVQLDPGEPLNLVNLGAALSKTQRSDEAVDTLKKAIALNETCAPAHYILGLEHTVRGEFDEAKAALRKTLEIDPQFRIAKYNLANLVTEEAEASEMIPELEQVLASGVAQSEETSRLWFAIAHLKNRTKDFDGAFDAYEKGNAIEHGETTPFDREEFASQIDGLIESFRPDVFETLRLAGNETEAPIFVVGMPRSGTTLTTQILASHPEASSAGEVARMQILVATLQDMDDCELRYPDDIALFNVDGLQAMGQDYLSFLHSAAPNGGKRIVDKLPVNFMNLGLIAVLFPNARIIHCKRNPLDTCLSCYFQRFDRPLRVTFANDMEDIAFYYHGYERLMAHWQDVLPGRILDVQYEDLVADQEKVSRELIAHTGLDWHPGCLEFHEKKARVHTASVVQARQPVYKSSVERWRNYEAHIGRLKTALKKAA